MKKYLCVIIACSLLLSMSACGKSTGMADPNGYARVGIVDSDISEPLATSDTADVAVKDCGLRLKYPRGYALVSDVDGVSDVYKGSLSNGDDSYMFSIYSRFNDGKEKVYQSEDVVSFMQDKILLRMERLYDCNPDTVELTMNEVVSDEGEPVTEELEVEDFTCLRKTGTISFEISDKSKLLLNKDDSPEREVKFCAYYTALKDVSRTGYDVVPACWVIMSECNEPQPDTNTEESLEGTDSDSTFSDSSKSSGASSKGSSSDKNNSKAESKVGSTNSSISSKDVKGSDADSTDEDEEVVEIPQFTAEMYAVIDRFMKNIKWVIQ